MSVQNLCGRDKPSEGDGSEEVVIILSLFIFPVSCYLLFSQGLSVLGLFQTLNSGYESLNYLIIDTIVLVAG